MDRIMSTSDEKFDRLIDVMLAHQTAPAMAVSTADKAEIGGWFVLKLVGGIVTAIITSGLIAGMFWVIKTVSDTSKQVHHNEQQRISDRQLDNQKIETIEITLKEVKDNTKDRFTSADFENKIQPIVESVNRNTTQIEVLATTLVSRSDFMTKTTTDIALLKRELNLKEDSK